MNKQDSKILDLTPLYNVAEEIIQNYRDEVIAIDAIGSGELLNSIDFDIIQVNENTLTLQLSVAEQYIWVEYGRSLSRTSGWDNPIDDLSNWIISKISRGKFIPKADKKIPTTQKEIRKTASAIYHKITNEGYYEHDSRGKYPLNNSLEKSIEQGLIERFAMALTQPLAGEVVADLKKLEIREKPKVRPKR